jgi:hypothetical protein
MQKHDAATNGQVGEEASRVKNVRGWGDRGILAAHA